MNIHTLTADVGTNPMTFETGKIAKLADGAVTVRCGDTIILVTAVSATKVKSGQTWFPLSVEYKEKATAAGVFPGGYFKREGRPTEKEILTCRMTDRPLRPLFPKGYLYETQIVAILLSADGRAREFQKHAGEEPANFLDIGGGASPERVAAAFRLVISDARVGAVLVNIFAGINRCDWIAQGVVQAAQMLDLKVPLIVRLAGTNVEAGQKIIAESGLPIITADTLADAAAKAVAAYRTTRTNIKA